jgi:hypothetical protein
MPEKPHKPATSTPEVTFSGRKLEMSSSFLFFRRFSLAQKLLAISNHSCLLTL